MADRWPEAVVFDLDGTLIDSVGDIADALNVAMQRAGMSMFSDSEVGAMIGGGARVLIGRVLAARGIADNAALGERLHRDFIAVYQSASVARTTVFDHARELIDELGGKGIKLAICTNKPASITEDVLAKLDLRRQFQAVIGATDALAKKPDPAMLIASLDMLGVPVDRAVMIGDSIADVGAARAAGVPVVLLSHGYTRVPVHELGADAVIDTLAHVMPTIAALQRTASR